MSYLRDTLRDLVRINSVNPTLVPEGAGEAEIGAYVAASLQRCSLEVQRHEPEPGRVSVVGRLRGSGGGRSLMLNAHYDTVGITGMAEPFSGETRDGKLYGRGAYDMKGSLAACMDAARIIASRPGQLRGDVLVAAVADEEYGSIGTADLCGKVKVDGAIVTEPTALKVCLAHKGYLWIEVEITGGAAHGSKFELGVDANMRMGEFLHELGKLERDLRARPGHPLVGPPSLHAAMIAGGSGLSTYAASCKLQIERRTVPGEAEAQVMAELSDVATRLPFASDIAIHPFFVRDPFEVARNTSIVQCVSQATETITGKAPEYFGDTPWMDSALLAAAGVETVVIGPAGAGAHADVEWVDIESVERLSEILVHAATEYCK
jgi:acetylornithine deacetylase